MNKQHWWPVISDGSLEKQDSTSGVERDAKVVLKEGPRAQRTIEWHSTYPKLMAKAINSDNDPGRVNVDFFAIYDGTEQIPIPMAAISHFGWGEHWVPLPTVWGSIIDSLQDEASSVSSITMSPKDFLGLYRFASMLHIQDAVDYGQLTTHHHEFLALDGEALDEYQLDGVRWLLSRSEIGISSILADGMGIGKTSQALVTIQALTAAKGQHCLVLLPAALIPNWIKEAKRFTPSLKIKTADDRTPILRRDYDCLLASIDSSELVSGLLKAVDWALLVVDEAQFIKNSSTKRWGLVSSISSRAKVLLTGTPIETAVADIHSLIEACHPGVLGTAQEFAEMSIDHPATARKMIARFLLRRDLESVGIKLPDLVRQDELLAMPQSLTDRYAAIIENVRAGTISGLAAYQELRRATIIDDQDETWFGLSAKGEQLEHIFYEAKAEQRKCLVFGHEIRQLDAISSIAQRAGLPTFRIDGGVPQADRESVVESFQSTDGAAVFTLSIKAASVGLNLQSATVVIFPSLEWNPAVESQAIARAWRRGQQRRVACIRLAYAGTLDEVVMDRSSARAELALSLAPARETPTQNELATMLQQAVQSWEEVKQ
jgi:SNF2 family DNA or RNA helicase